MAGIADLLITAVESTAITRAFLAAAGAGYQPVGVGGSAPKKQLQFSSGVGNSSTSTVGTVFTSGANTVLSQVYQIAAGGHLEIDLTNFTDIAGQTAQAMARVKEFQAVLLSANDDPVSSTCSGVTVNAPLPPPVQANISTSGAGGSIAANTYYYVITSITAAGESPKGNEKSIVTSGATSSNTLTWAQVPNATGYKIYRSTSSGTYGASSLITTTGAVGTYLDTAAAPSAGTPPSVNTAVPANMQQFDAQAPYGGCQLQNGDGKHWISAQAAGVAVDGTHKIVYVVNQDAVNIAYFQFTAVGGTS